MNRGASAAMQAEWAKSQNAPVHLLEVDFDAADGGPVYLTDAHKPLSWNGQTWSGLGHLLDFSGAAEAMPLRVSSAAVKLSGVDQLYLAVFQQRQFIDRRLALYLGFLDAANDAVIADPIAIHDGRIDAWGMDEDPRPGSLTLTVTSRDSFADFERLSGRHTNSTDQNILFPNDRTFDKLAQISMQSFVWGHLKEPPATGFGAALTRFVYSKSLSIRF